MNATGWPSCNRTPPKQVSLASTCNKHGLLIISKNFRVVAFVIALLAELKALSCWEDHDQTASTCVSSVSGLTISERFGVKRDK